MKSTRSRVPGPLQNLMDSNDYLTYDKRNDCLYLKRGDEYVRVPPEHARLAASYAGLRKLKGEGCCSHAQDLHILLA